MTRNNSIRDFLNAFQEAWSRQDIEGISRFFAEDLKFEDIPIGLQAANKEELKAILQVTFTGVPDFKMEILEYFEGDDFVVTKWKQTGTMTVKGYGLDLKDFPYEAITTSIIQLNKEGLIVAVSDNWNTSMFYQS